MAAWYMGSGNGQGNPYGIVAATVRETKFILPQFANVSNNMLRLQSSRLYSFCSLPPRHDTSAPGSLLVLQSSSVCFVIRNLDEDRGLILVKLLDSAGSMHTYQS